MPGKIAIFTEAEATVKLCPRTLGVDNLNTGTVYCHGSRCMAWRWYATHVDKPAVPPKVIEDRATGMRRLDHGEPKGTRLAGDVYGYCGLAGDPMGWSSP